MAWTDADCPYLFWFFSTVYPCLKIELYHLYGSKTIGISRLRVHNRPLSPHKRFRCLTICINKASIFLRCVENIAFIRAFVSTHNLSTVSNTLFKNPCLSPYSLTQKSSILFDITLVFRCLTTHSPHVCKYRIKYDWVVILIKYDIINYKGGIMEYRCWGRLDTSKKVIAWLW